MNLHTIGFTRKPAETFFRRLQSANIKRLVDVRLHNVSQLSGFAKRDDLKFFAKVICDIEYVHVPMLAPTKQLLDGYKKFGGSWDSYQEQFLELMRARQIESAIPQQILDGCCLLCSEESPHHCHRRLVAEYLRDHWGSVEIEHIP